MDDDTTPSSEGTDNAESSADEETGMRPVSSGDAPTTALEPFELEPVEVLLETPYVSAQTIAETDVELHVKSVVMRASRVPDVFDVDSHTVSQRAKAEDTVEADTVLNADEFCDVAKASEYQVYAEDQLVIDGGDETRVSWLEDELCSQVGVARRAKRRLMDAGWDADELDEFGDNAEDFLVDFYTNLHITGAENIVKGMAFRASDDEELIEQTDAAHPAEVRHWVEESRDQLTTALDALDELEEMAEQMLGDDYHTAALPTPDEESREDAIEEIRTAMFDSDMPNESFARREQDLPGGRTLSVDPGSYITEVVVTDEDGNKTQVGSSDSLAEAVYIFNNYLEDSDVDAESDAE